MKKLNEYRVQYGTYQPQRGAYLETVSQREKMEIISGKAIVKCC
jgi:hypothetical protein